MENLKLIYEGKAKRVYECGDPRECVIEYKNTATALNGARKEEFEGKGELNCNITAVIYRMLEDRGVRTHLIRQLDATRLLCRRVQIVPLEIIVRNIAAGSFARNYGIAEGSPLRCTVLEYSYKNDALGDPLLNDTHAIALGITTRAELDRIAELALTVNKHLTAFFLERGIRLVDFKIEIGRADDGGLLLADEISPDTCRLWDAEKNEKLDKDRFRRDLGGVMDAYREVYRRISE